VKVRAVYRALKGLKDDWKSQKSKKMQRTLAIEKIHAIRVLIGPEYRNKPKTDPS
jgi:hypothetical protein